jgi:cobalt/nickel transport system permease protein
LSVVVAAAICAVLLAISDTVPLAVAMTAMLTWHLMIGIGEAMITLAVVNFIWRTRPDLIYGASAALENIENRED